jgi:hypothetical protein
MKKNELIELVKRQLTGGDSPAVARGRFHDREIALYIGMVFDSLIGQGNSVTQNKMAELGMDSWVYDALTKSYQLDILEDTDRKRFYSTLPINVLSVVDNNGIRMITPWQDESVAFFPRRETDTFLMNDLDVNQISGLIYYALEGNKIYYSGDINCDWEKVRAKLVLKFSEFEDTDDIDIPNGKDVELFQLTVGLMKEKNLSDIVDDSTVMQTTK